MIVITMEGGLITSISSDDPKLAEQKVFVIDYIDDSDDEDIVEIPQGNGKTADAVVNEDIIDDLFPPIREFLKERFT